MKQANSHSRYVLASIAGHERSVKLVAHAVDELARSYNGELHEDRVQGARLETQMQRIYKFPSMTGVAAFCTWGENTVNVAHANDDFVIVAMHKLERPAIDMAAQMMAPQALGL